MAEEVNNHLLSDASKLTAEELLAFWRSLNIKLICEVCGANSWANLHTTDGTPSVINQQFPGSVDNLTGIPVFALGCNNCGNVKFFNKLHIYSRLRSASGGAK